MNPIYEIASHGFDLKKLCTNQPSGIFKIKKLNGEQEHRSERLQNFEIIYLKYGQGYLSVDQRKYTLNNNVFFGLVPGQYRSIECTGESKGYLLSFSYEFLFLSDVLNEYQTTDWILDASSELDDLVNAMNREYLVSDITSIEVIKNLFKAFIICLQRRSTISEQMPRSSPDRIITQSFFKLLQKHFASKKLVSDYADQLCITPNYLNAVVKKQTGFPASHHIQQFIIMEAKRKAMYSKLRMKEVADQLGFEDYAHFSKFFKNYSGMNFTTFRKSFL